MHVTIDAALVWLSAAAIGYVYVGYQWILKLLVAGRKAPAHEPVADVPTVTVLITAFNEQARIARRIENILSCDYESGRLRVLVASDGSTDDTDRIVETFDSSRVRLVRTLGRKGKSATQNAALDEIRSDIVIFTDANTRFSRDFVSAVARRFADPRVGAVDGHLLFTVADGAIEIAQGQNLYWQQELRIREMESALGVLAVASGACLAVRRRLLRQIPPFVGEDCVIPLDVVRQGFRVVHAVDAVACDELDGGAGAEYRTRVRMTLRNWQGTWQYPDLLNPFLHPGIAFALWSHKLLRWLSPVLLASFFISSIAMLVAPQSQRLIAIPGVALASAMTVTVLIPRLRRVPYFRTVWSFSVANAGFLVGVGQALFGARVVTYR